MPRQADAGVPLASNTSLSFGNSVSYARHGKPGKFEGSHMLHAATRRAICLLLILALGSIGLHGVAHAEMIGTRTLIEYDTRQESLSRIDRTLTQEAVREEFVAMGVDPAHVQARLAALSDQELQRLNGELDTLPAGGVLAVVGAVFVVLLVLEVVGVTNVFQGV